MYIFPDKFWWGASTSGVQTEGSKNKVHDSIWDYWHKKDPTRFYNSIGPDVVTDTYTNYKNDIKLMKETGLNSFRTSIQWSRLIKDFETGEVCLDAVNFYNNYFDELLNNGIEPVINLYHFDMPIELQEKHGGFESKHVVDLFVLFAKQAFLLFGNKIKFWTTFNEPIVPVEGGYLYDFHYPNKKDSHLAMQVGYNLILAHAKVVELFRNFNLNSQIGVILNLTPTYAKDDSPENLDTANFVDLLFNRSFLDPMVLGEFPPELCSILKNENILPIFNSSELSIIKNAKIDFLGVNYYLPRRVQATTTIKDDLFPDKYFDYYINPNGRFNPFRDNNEIYPKAIYDISKNIQNNYGNIPWFLAEIGIAMDVVSEGEPVDGIINDSFRTELLKEHLIQLHKAISEGSNCFGVHMWTFIDCWSWINSFKRRYGFYRLDLETGKRIRKSNSIWFEKVAKTNIID